MKSLLPVLAALTLLAASAARADDPRVAALSAMDDARVAAFKTADAAKLGGILSGELRYAHSTGAVDDKASLLETLTSGKTKYVAFDYEERKFTFPAPKIALMTGRARLQAVTAAASIDTVLSFLGVWREEDGQWRFLAWQSCKMAPAAAQK